MATKATSPAISVHPETKARLDALGKKGDSYNTIIVRLLDARKRFWERRRK